MQNDNIDDLPNDLYDIVQKSPILLTQIVDKFEKLKEEVIIFESQPPKNTHLLVEQLLLKQMPDKIGERAPDELILIREQLTKKAKSSPFMEGLRRPNIMNAASNILLQDKPESDELFIDTIKFVFRQPYPHAIQISLFNHKTDNSILDFIIPKNCKEYEFIPREIQLSPGRYYAKSVLDDGRGNFIVRRFLYCSNIDKHLILESILKLE